MFSAIRAMAWEFFRYGWLHLILSFLGGVGLVLFILVTLKVQNALVLDDPDMIKLHTIFLYINAMVFVSPVYFLLGNPARFFTLPLTSRAIALSQMIPTFLLVAGQIVLYTLLTNRIVGLDWPVVGPAIWLATTAVTFQAAIYLTQRSLWMVPLTGILLLAEGLWFKTRYGELSGTPNHFWNTVTAGEWVIMIATLAGSLVMGCYGMALNRCGESINTRTFEAWVKSWFESTPGGFPAFANGVSAQFWFEWRQKGWLFPGVVLLMFFGSIFIWLIVDRNIANLHYAFFVGGYVLALWAFISGLLFGNYGPQDSDHEMGHFLASRPMTNRKMSDKTVEAALASLALGWLFWIAGFGALHLLLNALGVAPSDKFVDEVRWWYVPATLVLAWIAMGIGMLMTIAGKGLRYFQVGVGCYIFWLIGTVALNYLSDPSWSRYFSAGCATGAGVALLVWTIWLYLEARRKRLLGGQELLLALAAYVVLAVVLVLGMGPRALTDGPVLILGLGLIATSVAPFAGAPLGLSWNRTR